MAPALCPPLTPVTWTTVPKSFFAYGVRQSDLPRTKPSIRDGFGGDSGTRHKEDEAGSFNSMNPLIQDHTALGRLAAAATRINN